MKQAPKGHEAKPKSADKQGDAGSFTAEQMAYIKNFIEEVGGLENAHAAIEALLRCSNLADAVTSS